MTVLSAPVVRWTLAGPSGRSLGSLQADGVLQSPPAALPWPRPEVHRQAGKGKLTVRRSEQGSVLEYRDLLFAKVVS